MCLSMKYPQKCNRLGVPLGPTPAWKLIGQTGGHAVTPEILGCNKNKVTPDLPPGIPGAMGLRLDVPWWKFLTNTASIWWTWQRHLDCAGSIAALSGPLKIPWHLIGIPEILRMIIFLSKFKNQIIFLNPKNIAMSIIFTCMKQSACVHI